MFLFMTTIIIFFFLTFFLKKGAHISLSVCTARNLTGYFF